MRDGAVGGNGYGGASNPGDLGWGEGPYRDDSRAYVPGQAGPYGGRPEPIPGGPGAGGVNDSGSGYEGYDGYGGFDGSAPGHDGPGHESPGREGPGRDGYDGPDDPSGPGRPGPDDDGTAPPGTEAGAAGSGADGNGGHRRGGPRRRPRSRRRRILRWVAIVAAVGVLGSAGAAYGYYEYLSGKIRKGERVSGKTSVTKPKANADGTTAMNILILGSDSRLSADDKKLGGAADSGGARADVIMIAHLSADRSNMSIVSIPRDTHVTIPPCTDPKTGHNYPQTSDIINASLGRGGAGCTLATVENLTKVYIDHWLMIDFSGVVKMADVLGGVDVCVEHSVWDRPTKYIKHGGSGLKLTKGHHIIMGQQALQWLRTRDAFGDDSGRAKAQHMYMSSLIRTLREQNLFTNPTRLNKIATTAMGAFEVSSEIGTPKKLYDLGMQLKSVPPKRMTMLTMPHNPDPAAPNAHYIPAAAANTVWSLLRNDVAMDANGKAKTPGTPGAPTTPTTAPGPAAAAPSTIPVTVVNGTAGAQGDAAVPNRAGGMATALKTAGFTKAVASRQADPSPGTTLTYPAAGGAQGKADATSVAKALKIPVSNVKPSATVQTITLTIGADWKSGTDYSTTLPKAGTVPTTADAINGADTTGCMPIQPIYRWAG